MSYFVPLTGLIAIIFLHMVFYARFAWDDSGFTGLMKKEEDLLMDSMVVIGGIQATYFLWRSFGAFSGNMWQMSSIIDTIGFAMLGFFTYVSYRLMTNGEKIVESYSVETHWGGSDGD